ncbi:MAG: FMN-binding protein [Spirochaetales bacterium]|nr:FMN-binding protein [Spirochaetales bacterium]
MKKGLLYTVVFMLVTTFLFVFLLSIVNVTTAERTQHNAVIALRKAVLNVLGISYVNNDDAYAVFDERVQKKETNGTELYFYDGPSGRLYAAVFSGRGLWGTIEGVLAVTGDMRRITGLEILNHNETPGLGGRISEKAFREQFDGEAIGPGDGIGMTTTGVYDTDHSNASFDGITGATQTSQRMRIIINDTLAKLGNILEDTDGAE